jgi:hypothetical protein
MDGADINQIAKSCHTSVEMIGNFHASHIKTSLDTAAINIRRLRKHEAKDEAEDDAGEGGVG